MTRHHLKLMMDSLLSVSHTSLEISGDNRCQQLLEQTKKECAKILSNEVVMQLLFNCSVMTSPQGNESSPTSSIPPQYLYNVDCEDVLLSCYYERVTFNENAKTLILFHGEGETIVDYINENSSLNILKNIITSLGMNILIVDYRGLLSNFTKFDLLKIIENDIHCIFSKLQLPQQHIICYGRGVLGGIVAIEFAKQYPKICAMILESTTGNVFELVRLRFQCHAGEKQDIQWEGLKSAICVLLSNQEKLKMYHGNLLLFHCQNDKNIPLSLAESIYDHTGAKQKCFVILSKGHSGNLHIENDVQIAKEIRWFLSNCGIPIPDDSFSVLLQNLPIHPAHLHRARKPSCSSSPSLLDESDTITPKSEISEDELSTPFTFESPSCPFS